MTEHEREREAVREEMKQRLSESSAAARARHHLGRRGAFLVTMGSLFVLLGIGYGFYPLPRSSAEQLAMPLLLISDMRVWGTLWIFSGVVAIINAWWPPGKDGLGFIFLYLFSSVWGVLNLLGAVFLGAERAWVTGLIFVVYALSVVIVSGMPDPSPIAKRVIEDDR